MEALARSALEGRGDAQLGEWMETSTVTFHLRRRLSAEERRLAGDLEVLDERGTASGRERLDGVFKLYPFLRVVGRTVGEV